MPETPGKVDALERRTEEKAIYGLTCDFCSFMINAVRSSLNSHYLAANIASRTGRHHARSLTVLERIVSVLAASASAVGELLTLALGLVVVPPAERRLADPGHWGTAALGRHGTCNMTTNGKI